MVTTVCVCPFCGRSEDVIRFGFTPSGSRRLRCKVCSKTWAPTPKNRSLSADKEALIVKALGERLSQRAIARTFGTGRDTIRTLLKKSLASSD